MTRDVIADLVAQVSLDGTKFDKGIGQVNRQLKLVSEELKSAQSRFRQTGDSQDLLGSKSQTLSGKLKLQQARVDLLNKAYNESKENTGEFSRNTQRLATQLERAKRELSETEHELKDVNQQLQNQPSKWIEVGKQAESAGEKMMNVGKNMMQFGQTYTMGVTTPIVASGVAVFKAASDFESAFAGVEKTFSGTEEQLADLRTGIRDMAKEIPASTTEIAAVAEAAGQLGIQSESIEEFTRTMIDLGESTNMSAETAATEFARFANIVGMSQENFDRLGSSTVALGNSMATTEAEISTMAMRLAAQGSQVGMTEAQIMALSATMSSLGIEAEAGGTAMTTVLKKIDSAVGESGEELESFAAAAGTSSSEFAKAWESDPISALDMFIKGLAESSDEGANLTTILNDLGIKGIREADTILRMAGASDLLTDAVKTSTDAWEENSALTDEAAQRYETTESQLRILWNRVKDMGITLGEVLIPVVMDAIDAAEPLIQKIEEGAQAFADMDEEQQRTILKLIALAAAIGPVSVGLGGLTTTIGGVLKVGGGLTSMLGKAGGKGLLGRFATMGVTGGPVGIAIAGVGALGLGIAALSQASKDNLEETLKSIEAREQELDTLDETIARFDELQNKNKLSTDEVLRYMDIMTELKNAKNEDTIKALTDEQQNLLEKSGMTNDEMEEFLGLNDKIVEKTPATTEAISEQGNAYAETTEEVKKLSAAERERLTEDTYRDLTSEMDKQEENLERQSELQQEIKDKEIERSESSQRLLDLSGQLREQDLVIAELKNEISNATGAEKRNLEGKLLLEQQNRSEIARSLGIEEQTVEKLDEQIGKKQTKLDQTETELKQFDELLDKYAQMLLQEQGIVAEKGKAVETIQQEQREIDTAREKLKEQWDLQKIGRAEYENQNEKLNEQQRKIDVVKGRLEEMNIVAGRTVYKDINVKTNTDKTYKTLGDTIGKHVRVYTTTDGKYARIGDPVTKQVNIRTSGGRVLEMYADGTNFHPGGPALVGEEGFELAKLGNRWSLLDLGIYDLPRSTQVFTHDESKSIIRALNSMPGYANGVSSPGEADRVVNDLNNRVPMTGEAVIYTTIVNQVDGRELSRQTYKYTTEFQQRDKKVRDSFA